MTAGLTA